MTTLLKPKEVAARLRINESSVYRMVNDGRMGSYVINHGTIRISEEQLDEYLESKLMPALERHTRKPYTRKSLNVPASVSRQIS